jgi:hypothetical protein
MKIKTFYKKLFLNKKTIVNLDNGEQGAVEGGKEFCVTGERPTCISAFGYTCCTTLPSLDPPCPSCE